jgi:hypothetical protein
LGLVTGYLDVFQEMHSGPSEEVAGTISWELLVTTPKPEAISTFEDYVVKVWTAEERVFKGRALLARSNRQHHRFIGAGDLEGFDPVSDFA